MPTGTGVSEGSDMQSMGDRLRLLHVVATVNPQHGGVAESILQRGLALRARGHQVEVATADAPHQPFVQDHPLPLHPLGPGWGPWNFAPRLSRWLLAHARDFDALLVDGLWLHHVHAAHAAARRSGTPLYVLPHGMLDSWAQRGHPWRHLKKQLVWRWVDGHALRDARAVIYTCEEERRRAQTAFRPYMAREQVQALGTQAPAGAAAAASHSLARLVPGLGERPFLLFLGRLHVKKAPELLLQAFAMAAAAQPELQLVMAGPGPAAYVGRLQALAAGLGIAGRVHWPGWIGPSDRWSLHAAAQAFVLPSHQENFGMAVAEALSVGTPVLISDQVNIHHEVAAGGAGLVAPDTLEGITGMLRRWLTLSSAERAAMGGRALQVHRRHFSLDASAEHLVRLVQQDRGV